MALDAESMALKIEDSMTSKGFFPTAEKGAGHDWWVALCEGIIEEIQSNAEVSVSTGSSAGTYKVT